MRAGLRVEISLEGRSRLIYQCNANDVEDIFGTIPVVGKEKRLWGLSYHTFSSSIILL